MYRISAGLAIVVLFLDLGCTSEDHYAAGTSAGNGQPSIHSLTIVPNPITRHGVVTAVAETKDPNQDEVTVRFRWFVNGTEVSGESAMTLDPERLKRGDRVSVEATPHDGKTSGAALRSSEVSVGNTLPVIQTLTLEPRQPKAGDNIKAELEGGDVDGDSVQYNYTWRHNGQVVLTGEQYTLDSTGFSRGDTVSVSVAPHDHGGEGKEARSQPVTISNKPPKFTSFASPVVAEGKLEYQVSANDPENDPITFSLESAPPGMTINEKTGQLQWSILPSTQGVFRIKIMVRDDHEGWASQEFDISPKVEAKS
ncbi:MAG: putative Ig domain-containing protein [Nitrospira sp.]|nr:putative Ig domain-containing protein [Nitrospira sp.]